MKIYPNRHSTYVMSPRLFCSIAFQNEIDYKPGGKAKRVRTDEERERMIDIFINKLTSGTVKQHSKKVCEYLNQTGSYIVPIGHIILNTADN